MMLKAPPIQRSGCHKCWTLHGSGTTSEVQTRQIELNLGLKRSTPGPCTTVHVGTERAYETQVSGSMGNAESMSSEPFRGATSAISDSQTEYRNAWQSLFIYLAIIATAIPVTYSQPMTAKFQGSHSIPSWN
ncbi:uncharacterized protein BDR25DRAFT_353505 [Lindgomyces ingoldianus]|uniref:Uncharacterized protein n=1 Tax=Lindgomyces ingoldianus TaxID=673940 RepID=A0ACB6QZQ6_9PLEO|nr:uncharacterized protein BDR25DRAFT_353505 [Lindgomyces ingoldianus]KAF2472483.1 hypothetical protein BDR25DRAFT_353505 [Lindgomyces ingoldianus]